MSIFPQKMYNTLFVQLRLEITNIGRFSNCASNTNCRESAEKIEAYLSLMTRAAIILGAGDTKKARWDHDECHSEQQRPRSIDLSEESRQDRIIELWHEAWAYTIIKINRPMSPCGNVHVVHHQNRHKVLRMPCLSGVFTIKTKPILGGC